MVEVEQRWRICIVAGEDEERLRLAGARDGGIREREGAGALGGVAGGIECIRGGPKSCDQFVVGGDPDARQE